jgi:hypothetical protein
VSKRSSSPPGNRAALLAQKRREQQQAERRGQLLRWSVIGVVVAAAIAGIAVAATSSKSGQHRGTPGPGFGSMGPESMFLETGTTLAGLTSAASGKPVNGVKCQSSEQAAYHIHAQLTIYVNGQLRPVPLGIGIVPPVVQQSASGPFASAPSGGCYYWMHTHAQDGVIHIESPTSKVYTLGDFFAIWGQPLSSNQVGPATGAVTVYVNGKRYSGDPSSIDLSPHEAIQLDVGTPAPSPVRISWSGASL